jgi:transcriptional regulator with XRE-family HTH domain
MVTRDQVKMARAVLGWGIRDLAREAGLTANTVTRFENGGNATLDTLERMKRALEGAGITFIPENGGPATIRPPRRST